ncbi:MAG: type II secretion system F family protein [Candidatus Omnitrophica bacterium]|nr:type II secretion system F family protein [Candidatus Omnitrophota bacterium]
MAKFFYKAKKGLNDVFEGSIEAHSQDEALNKLVAQGLFPVSIGANAPQAAAKTKTKKPIIIFKKGIGSNDLLIFAQKLHTLVKARVELLSSLRILYEQTENPAFKEIVLSLYESTRQGKAFSDSLGNYPKIFSPLFINIIKSGEASGKMDFALEQIAEFLQRQESLKTKIRLALAYPALLLMVGAVSIFVLISFVIPKLKPIFAGMGQQLPLITKIILKISSFSSKTWYILVAAVILVVISLYHRKGLPFYAKLIRKIKLRLPVIKRLVRNQELAHFARSLALLLNGGVVALKSLEVATLTIEDPKLKAEMRKVYEAVASGQSIAKSMDEFTSLPKFFIKMIAVGEESGRLGEVLAEILESYNQQIEADIMLISSLLEPILILVLGLILGTIVLAILLPTFQITQMVR